MAKKPGASKASPPAEESLNQNQIIFCQRYVEHGNAGRAYHEAYPEASMSTWRTNGPALLKKAHIIEYIQWLRDEDAKLSKITRQDILNKIMGIANDPFTAKKERLAAYVAVIDRIGDGGDYKPDSSDAMGRVRETFRKLGR